MEKDELQLTLADVVKTLNQTITVVGNIHRDISALVGTLDKYIDASVRKTLREEYLSEKAGKLVSEYAQMTQTLSEIEKRLRNIPKV